MNNYTPNDSQEPLLSNCKSLLNKFLDMKIKHIFWEAS